MGRGTRWVVGAVVGVPVLLIAVLVAYLNLPPWETRDVPMPPDDATPAQVVATYIAAINAHDCATARAVSTDEHRDNATASCHDAARLANVRIGGFETEPPQLSGLPATDEATGDQVTFDLSWRFLHDDHSMATGPTLWGYTLARTSPSAPWRIADEGTG